MTVQLYDADGTTPFSGRLDFGIVAPGSSKTLAVTIKNEGTAALSLPHRLEIATVGSQDMEAWLTGDVAGQVFQAGQPLSLAEPLAAGGALLVSVTCAVPADAPLSSQPLAALVDFLYA